MELPGNCFYFDNNWFPVGDFEQIVPMRGNHIYEVLRVVNGRALFAEDHFARFANSLYNLHLESPLTERELDDILKELIAKNGLVISNLRFEAIPHEGKLLFAAYLYPFRYPLPTAYQHGVEVGSYEVERPNPHVKQSEVNDKVRQQLQIIFESQKVFEVLLVDHLGNVTEGSRTNVFFVKANCLYSPPRGLLLEGITRKKVLEIAVDLDIKYVEQNISLSDIKVFDACFLTGTSPKILPVNSVNEVRFDTQNEIVWQLINRFNQLIEEYSR